MHHLVQSDRMMAQVEVEEELMSEREERQLVVGQLEGHL